jgi:hypothetical protein
MINVGHSAATIPGSFVQSWQLRSQACMLLLFFIRRCDIGTYKVRKSPDECFSLTIVLMNNECYRHEAANAAAASSAVFFAAANALLAAGIELNNTFV